MIQRRDEPLLTRRKKHERTCTVALQFCILALVLSGLTSRTAVNGQQDTTADEEEGIAFKDWYKVSNPFPAAAPISCPDSCGDASAWCQRVWEYPHQGQSSGAAGTTTPVDYEARSPRCTLNDDPAAAEIQCSCSSTLAPSNTPMLGTGGLPHPVGLTFSAASSSTTNSTSSPSSSINEGCHVQLERSPPADSPNGNQQLLPASFTGYCTPTLGYCPTVAACNVFQLFHSPSFPSNPTEPPELSSGQRIAMSFALGCAVLPTCVVGPSWINATAADNSTVGTVRVEESEFALVCPLLCGSSSEGGATRQGAGTRVILSADDGSSCSGSVVGTALTVGANGDNGNMGSERSCTLDCEGHGCCVFDDASPGGMSCLCYDDYWRGHWAGHRCAYCHTLYDGWRDPMCRSKKTEAVLLLEQLGKSSVSKLPMTFPCVAVMLLYTLLSMFRRRWISDQPFRLLENDDRLIRPFTKDVTYVHDPNGPLFKDNILPKRPAKSVGLINRKEQQERMLLANKAR